jgi:hypothetical protein
MRIAARKAGELVAPAVENSPSSDEYAAVIGMHHAVAALSRETTRRVEEGRLAGTYRQPTVSLRRVGPGTLTPSRSQNRR